MRQRAAEAVDEGVHYVAVAEDKDDAGGEANDEGCRENVLAAGEEELGYVIGALTVDDACQYAHSEEEGRDFGDVPSEGEHAHDEGHDGEQQEDKYQYMAQGERRLLVGGGSLAPVVVELVDWAAFRLGFDSGGVPQHEGDTDNSKD